MANEHQRLVDEGYVKTELSIGEAEEHNHKWARICHADGSYTTYVQPHIQECLCGSNEVTVVGEELPFCGDCRPDARGNDDVS